MQGLPLVRLILWVIVVSGVACIQFGVAVACEQRLEGCVDQSGVGDAGAHAPGVFQESGIHCRAQPYASHATTMPHLGLASDLGEAILGQRCPGPGYTPGTADPTMRRSPLKSINDEDKRVSDDALLALLHALAPQQPWWLGYLETGVADLVFPDAPTVRLYSGWPYVLVRAGPRSGGHLANERRCDAVAQCATRVDVSARSLVAGLHALGRRLEVRRRSCQPRQGTPPAPAARGACSRTGRGRHTTGSSRRVKHGAGWLGELARSGAVLDRVQISNQTAVRGD